MSFYFFVVDWQSVKTRNAVIFGILSALSNVLTNITWGGGQLIMLIIAIFVLIEIILNKFDKKDFYVYLIWTLLTIILLLILFPARFVVTSFTTAIPTNIITIILLIAIVDFLIDKLNLFKLKERFKEKIPIPILTLVFTMIISLFIATIVYGPSFIFNQ